MAAGVWVPVDDGLEVGGFTPFVVQEFLQSRDEGPCSADRGTYGVDEDALDDHEVQKPVHEEVSRTSMLSLRFDVRISSLKALSVLAHAATKWLAGGRLPSMDVWINSSNLSSMKMASW